MNETKSVEISRIVIDENFMMRESLDKELVVEYKENLESMPPITLYDTLQGLLLVDGFHRVAAAKQLSWEKINAEIVKGSIQDAFGAACVANLRHGKPLKPKEKKHAVCEYIKLNSKLSNVLIGQHVGKSEGSIRNYRNELIQKGELKSEEKRVGVDGKERQFANLNTPTSTNVEVDPFEEWFSDHVSEGNALEILADDPLKYDLSLLKPNLPSDSKFHGYKIMWFKLRHAC